MLKLFVSTISYESFRALKNIKKHLKDLFEGYELKVINVSENPEEAEKEGVIATPTLIKEYPLPQKRIVGDLSDKEMLLFALGLYDL